MFYSGKSAISLNTKLLKTKKYFRFPECIPKLSGIKQKLPGIRSGVWYQRKKTGITGWIRPKCWVSGIIGRSQILNLSEIEALLHKFLKFLKSEVTPKTAFFNREIMFFYADFPIKIAGKCRFWGYLPLQEFRNYCKSASISLKFKILRYSYRSRFGF